MPLWLLQAHEQQQDLLCPKSPNCRIMMKISLMIEAQSHANTNILVSTMKQHFCKDTGPHVHSHFVDTAINSVFRKTCGESKPSERIADSHKVQCSGSRVNLSFLVTKSKFNLLPLNWLQSLLEKSGLVQPHCLTIQDRVQMLPWVQQAHLTYCPTRSVLSPFSYVL